MAEARKEIDVAHVAAEARRYDPGRVLCAQFATPETRPYLLTLYAFNGELGRIRSTVSEPLLGRIKLQWWRDTLDAMVGGVGPPVGHPIAEALAAAMRARDLRREAIEPLLVLREQEMDAGVADLAAESLGSGAGGTLASLAMAVLGVSDGASLDAAQNAAAAYDLAEISRQRAQMDSSGEESGPRLHARARDHIAAARDLRAEIDRRALPVLLWTTLAEAMLRTPRGAPPATPPVLRLIWNAWRGRY